MQEYQEPGPDDVLDRLMEGIACRGASSDISDAEQPSHHKDGRLTQWCGAACLAFAAVAKSHGLKIAAHI